MATFGNGDRIEGLSVFDSGLTLGEIDLHGGEGFLDEVERFAVIGQLEEAADAALSGKSVPRVWAILDESGRSEGRAVAALTIARVLSRRGQKVVVLDADDHSPDLTRWAGLFEQEGWIDYLRYGASLGGCGTDLPWSGTRLLGVGTFCPTDIQPDEITDLLGRLRRQADDVLLCLPLDERGAAWTAQAGIHLLCWDRMVRDEKGLAEVVGRLEAGAETLAAVVAFGLDEETMELEIASALKAISETGARAASDAEPDKTPDERAEEAAADAEEALAFADDLEPVLDGEPDLEMVSAEQVAADRSSAEPDSAEQPDLAEQPVDEPVTMARQRQGSSPLFWRVAAVAAVLLIVVGYAWYSGFFRGVDEPAADLALTSVEADIGPSNGAVANPSETSGETVSGTDADETDDSGDRPIDAAVNEEAVTENAVADVVTTPPAETGEESDSPSGTTPATPAETEPAEPDPYAVPVGEAGWALHLFSFPDSTAAIEQAAELEARGIAAAWRAEQIRNKGEWYRVYVGSFANRADANVAKPELLARLRLDWADAREF